MNFVLTQNNNIIDGPKPWNMYMFQNALQDDLGISATLPMYNTSFYTVTSTVSFYPVTIVEPTINPVIQEYAGPFWTFNTGTNAVGTYTAVDRNIDHVKGNLAGIVATNRYNAEVAGTTATIQNTVVTIDTSREGRNIFVQQYLLMGASDTVDWKFPECWLTLTKSDLGTAVAAGVGYVKSMFVWEANKVAEINSCTTLSSLTNVVLTIN